MDRYCIDMTISYSRPCFSLGKFLVIFSIKQLGIFWNFFHVNSTNFANFFKKFLFPNFLFQEFEEENPNSGKKKKKLIN
jgi:hypothetical protein